MATKNLSSRLSTVSVLLVDDDIRISTLVRDILNSLGFKTVHIAKNGAQALEILEENEIDLIITDWQMSPVDGINLVKHLRSAPGSKYRFIPIIMLTGNAERHEVELARDAGVTEFVVKPFTAKALISRIILVVENPRSFVLSREFKGPDRRRRTEPVPDSKKRRKQDKDQPR